MMETKNRGYREDLIYRKNDIEVINDDSIFDLYDLEELLQAEFTLIEEPEEIDIQGIEELDDRLHNTAGEFHSIMKKINEILTAVKQLDRKINNKE